MQKGYMNKGGTNFPDLPPHASIKSPLAYVQDGSDKLKSYISACVQVC